MFSAGKDIEFYRTADNFYIFFFLVAMRENRMTPKS